MLARVDAPPPAKPDKKLKQELLKMATRRIFDALVKEQNEYCKVRGQAPLPNLFLPLTEKRTSQEEGLAPAR